jgi:ribosome-binding factor A
MRGTREKGRRGKRVANIIRQIVSEELILRLNDPRLAFVTVTGVDLAADLRFADIRISILGDAKTQKECLRAVQHAHGHIQEKVAAALVMRFCPILRFHLDESVKRSVSLSALIAQARSEDEANRADRIRRGVEAPAPEGLEMAETPPKLDLEDDEEDAEDAEDEMDDADEDETDDEIDDAGDDEDA